MVTGTLVLRLAALLALAGGAAAHGCRADGCADGQYCKPAGLTSTCTQCPSGKTSDGQFAKSASCSVWQTTDDCCHTEYCDGSGGITTGLALSLGGGQSSDSADPTCRTSCYDRCSFEQVLAAMAAAPDDRNVQDNGCYALGYLAERGWRWRRW